MKKVLIVLTICAMLLSLFACSKREEAPVYDVIDQEIVRNHSVSPIKNFKFKKTEGGVIITGYTGKDPVVVVPQTIKGKSVVAIEADVFANESIVKGIYIPKTVETLEHTFENNANLEVAICEGVQRISTSTFRNCTSLNTIVLNDSVTYLGEAAFAGCVSLESLYLSKGLNSIDKQFAISVFLDCVELTIQCEKNSYIERFAKEQNIPVVIV